ncbi:DUF1254 domain-containing protein [Phenylobacterium sp. LjRoot164]|uniref:DUF1254 domain-containing protein n=1 Tax=unclassified Phenylobacterium TaxID=2640670 RepID=UPI003ECC9978
MASQLQTNPVELRRAAADGVVLGFPLLLVDAVRRTHPVSMNQVLTLPSECSVIAPGLTDDDDLIVRASAWIDLSEGPMLLALPNLGGRYWAVSLFDAWGRRIGRVDPRTHPRGLDLMLAGPGWRGEAPKDAVARRAPTNLVWAVVRIAARSPEDLDAARSLAGKLALGPAEPPDARLRPLAGQVDPPLQSALDAVTTLSPHRLFHHLARLLARYPVEDLDLTALTGIGLVPGKAFHLPDETPLRDALTLGTSDGIARVIHDQDPAEGAAWRPVSAGGADNSASALLAGLGAAAPEDMQQWICDSDADGRPLMGSEPYLVRFAPGAGPPVDGFWTLGLAARAPSGALREGARRLDSRDALAFDPDGALTVRIDHQPADAPNWLPAPPGRLRLRLKLYWPKAVALAGGWRPPAPERIGGSRRSFTAQPENRESPL